METKIIFEDKDLLVLDKPAGMIVNRSDTTKAVETLQEWVEEYLKIRNPNIEIRNKSQIPNSNIKNSFEFRDSSFEFAARAGIVHRLDKETSGIILVAKTLDAFINLQAQFKERKVQKTYLALTHGKIEPEVGQIDVPVGRLPWNRKRFGVLSGGRESVTEYRVIRYFEVGNEKLDSESLISRNQDVKKSSSRTSHFSLLELYPKTGRTHQIRVHLQYIKHPIFADPLYAGRKTGRNDRKLLSRIFLHASKISFFHPASAKASAGEAKTNEMLSFESPLPEDLQRFLSSLSF